MKYVWLFLSMMWDRFVEDLSKIGWSQVFIVLLLVMAMLHATLLMGLSKHVKGLEQRIEQLENK